MPRTQSRLLIGHRPGFTLFDWSRVSDYLESVFGREADVIEIESALQRPYFKRVVNEAIYVY
jgi:predicted nucleotidyltransferase